MTKVYALGGSVITKDLKKLETYAEALNDQKEQVGIITGAGDLKKYIKAAKTNQFSKDNVGIYATRLHAKTLQTMLADSHPKIPESTEELEEVISTGRNFVLGGLTPGYSTDAVAAITAELTNSKLYITSRVDGIYQKDPEIEQSEKIDEIKPKEIREILKSSNKAGKHSLIDRTALRIIERSQIETKVMEGTTENLENPEQAEGTLITH